MRELFETVCDLDRGQGEVPHEFRPRGRQADPFGGAAEEWRLHQALEIAGGTMERRLGDADCASGAAKALCFSDRDKAAEMDVADLARHPLHDETIGVSLDRRRDCCIELLEEPPRTPREDLALGGEEASRAAPVDKVRGELGL